MTTLPFNQLTYRLRSPCGIGAPSDHDAMEEAANEIERLTICLSQQDGMAGRYKARVAILERELEQAAIRFETMHREHTSLTGMALIGGENCRSAIAAKP